MNTFLLFANRINTIA